MAIPEVDSEKQPLLRSFSKTETVLYARRWWVLLVFSLASFVQVSPLMLVSGAQWLS